MCLGNKVDTYELYFEVQYFCNDCLHCKTMNMCNLCKTQHKAVHVHDTYKERSYISQLTYILDGTENGTQDTVFLNQRLWVVWYCSFKP